MFCEFLALKFGNLPLLIAHWFLSLSLLFAQWSLTSSRDIFMRNVKFIFVGLVLSVMLAPHAFAISPSNPALNCGLGIYALCGPDCQAYESCLRNPPPRGCGNERTRLCTCLTQQDSTFVCTSIPNRPRNGIVAIEDLASSSSDSEGLENTESSSGQSIP
jgi:hypothetical protein